MPCVPSLRLAGIRLTQLDLVPQRKLRQLDERTRKKLGIRRKRDVFFLHSRIDDHLRKFFVCYEFLFFGNADRFVKSQFEFFFTDYLPYQKIV